MDMPCAASTKKSRGKRRTLEARIADLESEIARKKKDLCELRKRKAEQEKAEKEKQVKQVAAEIVSINGIKDLSPGEIKAALAEVLARKQSPSGERGY